MTSAPRRLAHRLKLRQLRAIEVISAQRSLLKASRVLGISQPALTRTLQDAEQIIGGRLFDRHGRGVTPTALGAAVLDSAHRILAELARLEGALDRLAGDAAAGVALGALPVAAVGLLPGVLTRLRATHPDVQVRLVQGRTDELLPLLRAGELDLVVGRLYPPDSPDGFLREALYDDALSFIARAGHPLLGADAVTLGALARFGLVLPTIGQLVGQEIDSLLGALNLARPTTLRASSMGFIRETLLTTDLVTLTPRLMLEGDLQRGTVCLVPVDAPMPPRPAGLILRPDLPGHAGVAAVIDGLRQRIAEMVAQGLLPPLA